MKEECISFKNKENLALRGILHYGDEVKTKNTCVIVLNTGLNDMVGWHRLQVKTARFLAEKGFNVLRFDNFGIGGSEGELEEGLVIENFARIETGLWAQDALSAVDFIDGKFSKNRIIFLGFCGGALTAIHAGAIDERVDGIINIAAPVTVSTKEYFAKKDPWSVNQQVKGYKKKLASFQSIKNFFSGKSDYSVVFNSVIHFIKHKVSGKYNFKKNDNLENVDIKNLNISLFNSFDLFLKRKKPILFYYAGFDNATFDFKKYFFPKYYNTKAWIQSGSEFTEDENANHIFSAVESQEQLKESLLNWLNRKAVE